MTITHSLSWSYSAAGIAKAAALSASSEGETNLEVVIPALSTDYGVAYVLDFSQCKGFFLLADAAMTVETNSGGAPGQTFSLTAGVPVAWIYGSGTCPVTVDVTALFVTSTAGGNLTLLRLVDATV